MLINMTGQYVRVTIPKVNAVPIHQRETAVRLRFTIGVVISAVLIYLSSYLSWGSFQVSFFPGSTTAAYFPYVGSKPAVHLNGWHGNLKLFGVILSNWFIPAAAVLLAILSVTRSMSIFDKHALISMALAFYGALHTGHVVYALTRGGELGAGSILSAVLFIVIMFLLLREMRKVRKV
jgi:hypothetical protein